MLDGVHMRLGHYEGENDPTEAHGARRMLREEVPAKKLCELEEEPTCGL